MKKQTAVEFLIERWLERRAELKGEDMFQAMQMEKEQIIFSFIEGALISEKLESKPYTFINYAEQYYNETFKSE